MTAFFLDAPGAEAGQRFCKLHEPRDGVPRAAVVYVHPWAEEMNKSRRMAALGARALADAGCAVLQIDLLGCGDSSGEFADASWAHWVDDVVLACRWLRRYTAAPMWLWGLRAGCMVAAEAAPQLGEPCKFLFWQPVLSGKLALQQFLRLRGAADALAGQASSISAMHQQLAAGEGIDVAGYRLTPALANGLEHASLTPPQYASRAVWLEVSSRDEPALLPASVAAIERWRDAGHEVLAQVVVGPSFWATLEIEESPALVVASVDAMAAAEPQGVPA